MKAEPWKSPSEWPVAGQHIDAQFTDGATRTGVQFTWHKFDEFDRLEAAATSGASYWPWVTVKRWRPRPDMEPTARKR